MNFEKVLEQHALWDEYEAQEHNTILGRGDPSFKYGVATSMFQDSGSASCPNSQWAMWERTHFKEEERSGKSAALFDIYLKSPDELIDRLDQLKVNTYRFSIEWSHLEPEQGQYDLDLLRSYVTFCQKLRDHGIEPVVTLHHFSEPNWFHEIGSFEHEKNIDHFVKFAEWLFPHINEVYKNVPLIQIIFTINEPAIEAYCRYLVGEFSPRLRLRFKRGARFLLNMLRAHTRIYASLHGKGTQIGICHQYLKFVATHALLTPVTRFLAEFHTAVLRFFETGEFKCHFPLVGGITAQFESKPKCDLVGVQYYSRVFVGLKGLDPQGHEKSLMRGMLEDPEGLYEAIVQTHRATGAPVMVTENGISTQSDAQRARYLKRALLSAEAARQTIGAENMRGYIMWSFCDNFEWAQGWGQYFGAYAMSDESHIEPEYKKGVQPLVDMIEAWSRTN